MTEQMHLPNSWYEKSTPHPPRLDIPFVFSFPRDPDGGGTVLIFQNLELHMEV